MSLPSTLAAAQGLCPANRLLEIRKIRRDGATNGRAASNLSVVKEYAESMNAGTVFPPVRVWFDGVGYWLSDGFHRVAAAELIGTEQIMAEILVGTLEDARWDSYSANRSHGIRRNKADIAAIITGALAHPQGLHLSNNQIAQHLGIPEATLRRWTRRLSSTNEGDVVRLAQRAGKSYRIDTSNIGKRSRNASSIRKSLLTLNSEFQQLKQLSSPETLKLLLIVGHWIFGEGPTTVCLDRLEDAVRDLQRGATVTSQFE